MAKGQQLCRKYEPGGGHEQPASSFPDRMPRNERFQARDRPVRCAELQAPHSGILGPVAVGELGIRGIAPQP